MQLGALGIPLARRDSLTQRVVAILRKPSLVANVYLPGIGWLNGLTAGNYLDSTGTTAATVDNPVGLVLDGAGSVGAELVTNGDFSNGTTDWTQLLGTQSVVNGRLRLTANGTNTGRSQQAITCVVGKSYLLSYAKYKGTDTQSGISVAITSGTLTGQIASNNNATDGSLQLIFVATQTTHYIIVYGTSAVNGTYVEFDNISVKEVTGIHATQATTANKPILRLSGGKYSWQFDGTDYLSLGSVPFQMADDHCVIVGAKASAAATVRTLYSQRSTTSTTPIVANLSLNTTNNIRGVWRDDAAVVASISGATVTDGEVFVASVRKTGNLKQVGKNGVFHANTSSTVQGATTINTATIGASITTTTLETYDNSIYPEIAIKGTVSDADHLILSKFVGQWCGVTI